MFRSLILLLSFVTCGCVGQSVTLVGRSTGLTSRSTFPVEQASNDVKFAFGKNVFVGRWSYFHGVSVIDDKGASVLDTKKSDKKVDRKDDRKDTVALSTPNGGIGSFFGSSRDGSILHCTFTYNEGRLKGLGMCEDTGGEMYDLSIN
ncbi:MAG TPA: hypothetical protein HPQ04_00335 [Rhodospirillaceae bacterium]|nr:hypothetical protein [Rhodospirillaceae bacterium]